MNPILYAKHERPDSSTPLFDIATPEEIKANHGTCETCEYRANYHCDNPDSFAYGAVFSYPSIAYCNHHVPKET